MEETGILKSGITKTGIGTHTHIYRRPGDTVHESLSLSQTHTRANQRGKKKKKKKTRAQEVLCSVFLPSFGFWVENTDISCPCPAIKPSPVLWESEIH